VRSQILLGNPLHQFPCLRIVQTVMTRPADCQDILFDSKSALRASYVMGFTTSGPMAETTKAIITTFYSFSYFR
jgi:hypothetical protein